MLVTRHFADSHWLPWFFLSILWLLTATSNCLFTNIIQNIFVFNRRKETQTGLGSGQGE